MNKIKGIFLIIAVLSILLFPILTQASYELIQHTPLGINSLDKMKPNGEYSVYIYRKTGWQEVGDLSFDKFFRERKIDLGGYISDTETVKIRLLQKGGGAAHIDSIFLGGISPAEVRGIQDSFALKKLSQKDHDVIDAYGKNIEVMFSAKGNDKILTLTARVENEKISKIPFQFPLQNLFRKTNEHSEFYTYTIGSRNESRNPFFKEYALTGSGHPSGFTYGWVSNDEKNLYVKIDFTPDNTMDGDKDYAKVYVKTEKGLKEYKVSVPEKRWGKSNFVYTDNVAYQHKVYDLRIPFNELGIQDVKDGENLLLAFAAYGTASPGEIYASGLAYNPANNRYLAVFHRVDVDIDNDIYGQILNCDGTPYGPEFTIFDSDQHSGSGSVAYDSDNNRFLVLWGYNDDIHGQLVNADGSLFGGNITISNAINSQEDPVVAYDDVNGRYLAVWGDRRNYATDSVDVYGQLVNADGTLDGTNFVITDNDQAQHNYEVAYDGTTQRFLVAWEDLRNASQRDLYGRVLNANGTPFTGEFVISDAVNQQWGPHIANDSTNDRFLVVWYDDRTGGYQISDIYGQIVNADGTLNGNNFPIADNVDRQFGPEAVYDSINNLFLTVWYDERNSSEFIGDIYGQFIGVNGSLNGINFVVAADPNIQYGWPQIDYNSNFENFLVFYNTRESSVYDLASSLIGPSCEGETTSTIIPTLTEWGMILFLVLAGLGSLYYLRRKKIEG